MLVPPSIALLLNKPALSEDRCSSASARSRIEAILRIRFAITDQRIRFLLPVRWGDESDGHPKQHEWHRHSRSPSHSSQGPVPRRYARTRRETTSHGTQEEHASPRAPRAEIQSLPCSKSGAATFPPDQLCDVAVRRKRSSRAMYQGGKLNRLAGCTDAVDVIGRCWPRLAALPSRERCSTRRASRSRPLSPRSRLPADTPHPGRPWRARRVDPIRHAWPRPGMP